MGNRVEDLETQVAELQAAVDGLTEELVETKERLSQLESTTEVREEESAGDSHAEFVPNAAAAESAETGTEAAETATGDAPRSARTDGETADEGAETGESGESGESEESDDIIVA